MIETKKKNQTKPKNPKTKKPKDKRAWWIRAWATGVNWRNCKTGTWCCPSRAKAVFTIARYLNWVMEHIFFLFHCHFNYKNPSWLCVCWWSVAPCLPRLDWRANSILVDPFIHRTISNYDYPGFHAVLFIYHPPPACCSELWRMDLSSDVSFLITGHLTHCYVSFDGPYVLDLSFRSGVN